MPIVAVFFHHTLKINIRMFAFRTWNYSVFAFALMTALAAATNSQTDRYVSPFHPDAVTPHGEGFLRCKSVFQKKYTHRRSSELLILFSTLAAAASIAFVLLQCFKALNSRMEDKGGLTGRRLARGSRQSCIVSSYIHTMYGAIGRERGSRRTLVFSTQ